MTKYYFFFPTPSTSWKLEAFSHDELRVPFKIFGTFCSNCLSKMLPRLCKVGMLTIAHRRLVTGYYARDCYVRPLSRRCIVTSSTFCVPKQLLIGSKNSPSVTHACKQTYLQTNIATYRQTDWNSIQPVESELLAKQSTTYFEVLLLRSQLNKTTSIVHDQSKLTAKTYCSLEDRMHRTCWSCAKVHMHRPMGR